MDPKKRIADIEDRLRGAKESVAQIKGRYESAKENLAAVEQECRDKKVDPDKIDTVITKLEERLDEQATQLEKDLERAEKDLAPFLGETT